MLWATWWRTSWPRAERGARAAGPARTRACEMGGKAMPRDKATSGSAASHEEAPQPDLRAHAHSLLGRRVTRNLNVLRAEEARDRVRAEADNQVNLKAEILREHLTREVEALRAELDKHTGGRSG